MGGNRSFDKRYLGEGVAQGAFFKGMDFVFEDLTVRGVTKGDLENPEPAGAILTGETIEPKAELLGVPAVSLVMEKFPGTTVIKD
jgi:hypothetical protein